MQVETIPCYATAIPSNSLLRTSPKFLPLIDKLRVQIISIWFKNYSAAVQLWRNDNS